MCKYNYVTSILLKSTESTCLRPGAMLLLVDHSGGVKLKDLVNELQEVTDWFALGVYLGLEMSTLESVRADSMGIDEGRRSMLGIWMREQEATLVQSGRCPGSNEAVLYCSSDCFKVQ